MRKVPIFILCLLCLPLLGAATLTQSLEELPWEGKMPIHKSVGLLSDPAKGTHPTVAKSQQAFSSPYGPLWFDHYVATESRTILNRIYDPLLSSILPAKIVMGEPQSSGSQVAIPLLLEGRGESVRATVVWVEEGKRGWVITSISLL
ncbi:MAG: hypothetical protein ACOXZ2_07715 [Sphaerochaetaceae bacterium]|nr:hypothetical protein [Sphaerochaetaceae bacterium]HHU88835.1 hypothetical protein [Spirochaetales bacterium]